MPKQEFSSPTLGRWENVPVNQQIERRFIDYQREAIWRHLEYRHLEYRQFEYRQFVDERWW
jgi:hypothetical protein